jgi:hypothetical protein
VVSIVLPYEVFLRFLKNPLVCSSSAPRLRRQTACKAETWKIAWKSTETTLRIGVKLRPAENEKVFNLCLPMNSGPVPFAFLLLKPRDATTPSSKA